MRPNGLTAWHVAPESNSYYGRATVMVVTVGPMGWLIFIAVVIALLPVVVEGSCRRRAAYLNWVAGWVMPGMSASREAEPRAEPTLTAPVPGSVVGLMKSDFSGDGYIALVDYGVRLTERPRSTETTWGAFWPALTGYVILRDSGDLRIEVMDHSYVHIETRGRTVRGRWESILELKGVPRSGS